MIKFDSRYFNNAHRLSFKLAASVTGDINDGTWLTLDTDGNAVISDGTANTVKFMTISSRYGNVSAGIGNPITADPNGRDTITPSGMVSVLIGPYRLVTDMYATGVYTVGCALKVTTDGKLAPWVGTTDSVELKVGYCFKVPTATDATIGIIHE